MKSFKIENLLILLVTAVIFTFAGCTSDGSSSSPASDPVSDPVSDHPADFLINANEAHAGEGFFAAIDGNGDLYMWGLNTYGQLGLGDTVTRTAPQLVTHSDPNFDGFDHVAITGNTVYAIDTGSGKICVWGEGFTSSPVLLPDDDEVWVWITADDLSIMATDETTGYLWADVIGFPFSDRITSPYPDYFSRPQFSGGGGILYSFFGSLRIAADTDFPPLTIDSDVESDEFAFAKSGEMLAYIKNGRLYFIESVGDMMQYYYNELDTSAYPTQVGIDTDWLFVYSSEDGLIAGKADDENGTLHVYGEIGDDIYTEWTEVSLDLSSDSEDLSRMVTIWYQDRYLYLPDGARMYRPSDPDK